MELRKSIEKALDNKSINSEDVAYILLKYISEKSLQEAFDNDEFWFANLN